MFKCQMSVWLNFCRSVPPEFLRSFFLKQHEWCFGKSFEIWRASKAHNQEVAKGKQQILKKQFYENESTDLFSSRSLDVSPVIGNTPLSGLMQLNCRNWCPATTLGIIFWVWFDLWRLPRETVSKPCSLLEVILLLTINLSTLSQYYYRVISRRRML